MMDIVVVVKWTEFIREDALFCSRTQEQTRICPEISDKVWLVGWVISAWQLGTDLSRVEVVCLHLQSLEQKHFSVLRQGT